MMVVMIMLILCIIILIVLSVPVIVKKVSIFFLILFSSIDLDIILQMTAEAALMTSFSM